MAELHPPPVPAAGADPVTHASLAELEAALPDIRRSPTEHGRVEMLVTRPGEDRRRTPARARLTVEDGLEGDDWRARGSRRTAGGGAHPDMQVAVINARVLHHLARCRSRWPLAGDQLVLDLDLGVTNLVAGERLRIGSALAEVTPEPHTGCAKFAWRYGRDALRFVSSPTARELRLRGVYMRVVASGTVTAGDVVTKMRP